jgi:hypothetical protein
MKKIVLILVMLALAAAGGAYWYFYAGGPRTVLAVEAVLPADTLAVIKVFDAKKQVERFKAGRMGRSLAGMDFPAVLKLTSLSPEEQEKLVQFKDRFQDAVNSTWFDTLFGQEFALALQPLPAADGIDARQAAGAVVLVARPRQPAKVLESLNSMFAAPLSIRTQAFQQWTIHEFTLANGQSVYYTLADGLLIATASPDRIEHCLTQSLDPGSSLLRKPAYQGYSAELYRAGETDSFFYGDLGRILETARQAIAPLVADQPELAGLQARLKDLEGLETAASAAYDDGGPLTRQKTILRFDPARLSESLRVAFGESPDAVPPLQQVPAGPLFYSWQNNLNMDFYWREILKTLAPTPEAAAKIRQEFLASTGVDVDRLVAAFGSQGSFLLTDVKFGWIFPLPELAVSVGVKDSAMVKKAVQGFAERMGVPMEKESYQGRELIFSPMGEDLGPAFTCSGSVCTLAINRRLLHRILDAPQKGSLSGDAGFRAVDQGLSAQNTRITFWNFRQMVARARQGLDWAKSRMAVTQPDKGERFRNISRLAIEPVLDGLSGIQALGTRTYMDGKRVVNEVYIAADKP